MDMNFENNDLNDDDLKQILDYVIRSGESNKLLSLKIGNNSGISDISGLNGIWRKNQLYQIQDLVLDGLQVEMSQV